MHAAAKTDTPVKTRKGCFFICFTSFFCIAIFDYVQIVTLIYENLATKIRIICEDEVCLNMVLFWA